MKPQSKKLKVWQIDAAQMTPFYNIALCTGLGNANCDVTYVASRYLYTNLVYPANIDYRRLYFRGIDGDWLRTFPRLRKILRGVYYPYGNWQLLREIRSARPEVVHFQWSRLPRFDLWLIRELQESGFPVVHTVHDVIPLYEKSGVDRLYDVYRQCDALIVHSEANKQFLLAEVSGLDSEKVFILPLVDAPFPEPQDATCEEARDSLGIPQDTFVVLFFGLVKAYKGIDVLLEAIKLVNQQTDQITWLIVGKADDESQQDYLDQINALERTFVFSEYIPNEAMWQYYHASDISVFPYRHIFQSAALITAMSFGLPIIATEVGSFPETIQGNGVLIPTENPQALSETIVQAQGSWDLEKLGQRSLAIIEERHRSDHVGKLLREIYETLI